MKIDPYLFILPYTVSVILVLSSAGIKTLYCLMLQENKTYLPTYLLLSMLLSILLAMVLAFTLAIALTMSLTIILAIPFGML